MYFWLNVRDQLFSLLLSGYDWIERWTVYFGSVAALCVPLFPLDANSDPLLQRSLTGMCIRSVVEHSFSRWLSTPCITFQVEP